MDKEVVVKYVETTSRPSIKKDEVSSSASDDHNNTKKKKIN